MNIQIMKIYSESFHDVRSHKREWMRVAGGPLLVWALGAIFLGVAYIAGGQSFEMEKAFMGGSYFEQESSGFLIFAHAIYSITYFIAMTSLYINGYRYAILKEEGDGTLHLNLNIRFVKMVLYTILVGILAGLYVAASAGIIFGAHALFGNIGVDVILGIFLGLYAYYLMLRIGLFPVAISIDHIEPIKTSWRLMKGNVLRVLGLSILIVLTIALIAIVGAAIVGLLTLVLSMISPILGILSLILWFLLSLFLVLLVWAVMSKALGLVYQTLSTKN